MALQQRLNQQSLMLYFLCDSIDDTTLATLNMQPGSFTINGNSEGACFLKEVITKSYVDTNATVDTIRCTISHLDDRIKELKFDIKSFNEYVWAQVSSLSAHGVQFTELLTNIFSAYKQVQDAELSQQVGYFYFQHMNVTYVRATPEDQARQVMLTME
jgi:hypothetical protein